MQRFGRQHVNGSETLLRSARNQFHTTIPLICYRGSSERLVLVRSELLGQFVKTLTTDCKYSRYNRENFVNKFQGRNLRNRKLFLDFFLGF